jgi:hypothetical protein
MAANQGRPIAISDGNAGAGYATFRSDLAALDDPSHLRWADIDTNQWQGKMHFKQAEFLVADRFDWSAIVFVGCHNATVASHVTRLLPQHGSPNVGAQPSWYY